MAKVRAVAPTPLELELQRSIGTRCDKWISRERMTFRIKKCLAEYAKAHGLYACAKPKKRLDTQHGEWLYDVSLLECDPDCKQIKAVPLILESEWTPKGIMDDFQKLLVSCADLRVMLFLPERRQKIADIFSGMQKQVEDFAPKCAPHRYLLGGWRRIDKRFIWKHLQVGGVR